jgi:hypothetical protein
MTMNRPFFLLLIGLLFAPFAMAGQSVTRVSWESIDGSGPGRPTVSVVSKEFDVTLGYAWVDGDGAFSISAGYNF